MEDMWRDFPSLRYGDRQFVAETFTREVGPFRTRPLGTREYPYLGEKGIRELMYVDGGRGETAALCGLAAAFLAQMDHEVSSRQASEKNQVGLQGGHVNAGTSIGMVLTTGGREALEEMDPPCRAKGPPGWQFDGRLWTQPLEAAIALGRRYSRCLMLLLKEQQLAVEPPEERERLTRFSI